jgi:hypothetical protein
VALDLADLLGGHWEATPVSTATSSPPTTTGPCGASSRAARPPSADGSISATDARKSTSLTTVATTAPARSAAPDQQIWTAKQEARLLPVPYFMVTFTLPEELRTLCLRHPEALYPLLLRQSAAALHDVCATKTGGAKLGFTSVLHTWGRQIQHHPHVHLIVPGVAFHPKHQTLHHPARDSFLIHYQPLAARFRSRLHSALKDDHPELYQSLTFSQRHVLSPAKHWIKVETPIARRPPRRSRRAELPHRAPQECAQVELRS